MAAAAGAPVFLAERELCPAWVTANCGIACERCVSEKGMNQGMSGASLGLFTVYRQGGEAPLSVVLKSVKEDKRETSIALGLGREAIFYQSFASSIPGCPAVYYAHGDMESGAKYVLMEDLSALTQTGFFFGPGNPNNWGKDLAALAGPAPPPPREVLLASFLAAARVHAAKWRDASLLSLQWLRGAAWVRGEGRESWEASQAMARQGWGSARAPPGQGQKPGIKWDPLVAEVLDASVAAIGWEAQQRRLNAKGAWTLVHGDFHPANLLWRPGGDGAASVVLLDWEMVGVGSGPQDLGQFMISHVEPATRRACEREVVRAYYDELLHNGVTDYSWEECWQEYVRGGLERWAWFLCYFGGAAAGSGEMVPVAQFFVDQVAAFLRDHGVKPGDLGQPRP